MSYQQAHFILECKFNFNLRLEKKFWRIIRNNFSPVSVICKERFAFNGEFFHQPFNSLQLRLWLVWTKHDIINAASCCIRTKLVLIHSLQLVYPTRYVSICYFQLTCLYAYMPTPSFHFLYTRKLIVVGRSRKCF